MTDFSLQVEKRSGAGSKGRHLRAAGLVPAVVYGGNGGTQTIQLGARELDRTLEKGGASSLLYLVGPDFPKTRVLIRELQRHPVRRNVLHVDFVRVAAGQKITMAVPLHVVGHAPATELGAVLLQNVDSLEITCLPDDLPHAIEIDISGMAEVNDRIFARDLALKRVVRPACAVRRVQTASVLAETGVDFTIRIAATVHMGFPDVKFRLDGIRVEVGSIACE